MTAEGFVCQGVLVDWEDVQETFSIRPGRLYNPPLCSGNC